ncbi:site-specific integrase [Alistipes shahii]|uniref:Site-specific recombinase XerD n=1 Tax=Alistipes shahii WAL 8301 TaxID=717959 RepID=D4IK56_9BACT|nr:site-specific integrase [Alistipes shahii]UWN67473.1 site-specific integrase [Alistipes shahii WAL 8301]CBK63318.1 Site-specific recombinase XerD [Alistipes shahii WAL 8301]
MKRDSFRVLFFLKKTRLLKNGEASVCMRITVNGTRVENNIRKSIDPALWSQAKETARGKSRRACDLNTYIEEARIKLYQIFCELEQQNRLVTAHLLQELFFGQEKPEEVRTLLGTMQEHNDQCRALVGTDYALITVRRYESCRRYLAELIRQRYGKEDLPLTEVNGELVRAFAFYLKTEKGCQQNTVIRYMKCLKKITNLACANDWMAKDPFLGIRFHEKEVVREFLTMDELQTIYHKEFPLERLTLVRDVFIFAAFTGLAFIDVQQLAPEHIVRDNNGNLWIRKPRQKTKNMCNIPLLDIPQEILRKYADHPTCRKKGVLLPVPCNQKMNSYLKEIADICMIRKNLTTHCARHSYATSVCLVNGVSLENVAKMLGHSNIKMTQHYARVLDSSILRDMMQVERAIAKLG